MLHPNPRFWDAHEAPECLKYNVNKYHIENSVFSLTNLMWLKGQGSSLHCQSSEFNFSFCPTHLKGLLTLKAKILFSNAQKVSEGMRISTKEVFSRLYLILFWVFTSHKLSCITTFFSLFQLWSVNFPHGLNGQAVTENVVKVFNQGQE